jgi:hypothetical protein
MIMKDPPEALDAPLLREKECPLVLTSSWSKGQIVPARGREHQAHSHILFRVEVRPVIEDSTRRYVTNQ